MNKDLDAASISRWHYYLGHPQQFAQLPGAWQLSLKAHYEAALQRQRLRQRQRALPLSLITGLALLSAAKSKAATTYATTLTGTSADTAYTTSTDANGNLVYRFADGDSISTTASGAEDIYGVNLQTASPKVVLQAGSNGSGQLSVAALRPVAGSFGVAEAISVTGGANLTVNANTTVHAQSDDAVPNSSSIGVNVANASATFNGTTTIVTDTPGYSKGLNVYQGQVTFNGATSITAQARGAATDAIYNSGGGASSIVMNGNVTLVSYGIWPSDDVHGIYNDNVNSKLSINGDLSLAATSNGSTVMGIRNQGILNISGNASITATGPRSAYGVDNTYRTSRLYVGGDLTVSVSNSTGYTPFGLPTGLSNLYGMGSSMTFAGAANVGITAVTDTYGINNNGVVTFNNAGKSALLRASTTCATCTVYGIANNGGSITFAGGLDVAESGGGTRYAIWNAAADGQAAQVNVNAAGTQTVKIAGDILTGSVTDSAGNSYAGVTTLNFADSTSYLQGLVLGDSGSSGSASFSAGATNLSFTHGASWIPAGTGTLSTDFGSGSLTLGSGAAIDMSAAWGSFSASQVPAYSYRTLEIGSTAAGGASVQLGDGAVFTLLSDIRNGQADKLVFGSGIASFAAQGTLGIRIAYDPVLNATSWVNASTLQNGTSLAASAPIVIADASAAAGGTAAFQAVQGLSGQWNATYENALVRFSYVPQVSLSADRKQVVLSGIDIIGNGGGSATTGNAGSATATSGATTSVGIAGTGANIAAAGSHAAVAPATGVMVAADTVRALANLGQLDDAAVNRRSEALRLDQDAETSALWVDTDAGELRGDGVDGGYRQSETSVSLGADRRTGFDSGYNVTGVVLTRDQSHADLPEGRADLRGTSLAVYSSWVSAQGVFADVVARAGQLRGSYAAADTFAASAGRERASSRSVSVKVGRRLQTERGGYIEPQLQAAYGSVGPSSYVASNRVRFDVHANHSFLSRAGVVVGKVFSVSSTVSGNAYARTAVVHMVGARPDLTASLDGGTLPVALPSRHATAAEAAAGARLSMSTRWQVFAEAGRSSRTASMAGGWRASAGLRLSW